jgi:ubiquinone/menaquinone biosynthesis C-methylase UbiE
MNYFASVNAAERYARGRLYFHPYVMERIADRYPAQIPFARVLDVGCGTGMSSEALLLIANEVVATDASLEMLAQAKPNSRIAYVQAPAEALPFPDKSADVLTCCMSIHWFDLTAFLQEVRRVLKPEGVMVSYGYGTRGKMIGQEGCEAWFKEVFQKCFPTPPRRDNPQLKDAIKKQGFTVIEERYEQTLSLSLEQLVSYLCTYSGVIRATQDDKSLEDIESWLVLELQPFFTSDTAQLVFGGHIWFITL